MDNPKWPLIFILNLTPEISTQIYNLRLDFFFLTCNYRLTKKDLYDHHLFLFFFFILFKLFFTDYLLLPKRGILEKDIF